MSTYGALSLPAPLPGPLSASPFRLLHLSLLLFRPVRFACSIRLVFYFLGFCVFRGSLLRRYRGPALRRFWWSSFSGILHWSVLITVLLRPWWILSVQENFGVKVLDYSNGRELLFSFECFFPLVNPVPFLVRVPGIYALLSRSD